MLKKSFEEYGDLSGIVFNRKTAVLVGGHQRSKLLDESAKITIEKKYSKPTKTGTVAEGFIEQDGERFRYREVSWSATKEKAANIAANKGAGDWDKDLLSEWMTELSKDFSFDLDLTMFDEKERSEYLKEESKPGLCDEDEVPEVKKAIVKRGDIWQLGNHRLMCGDSTSIDDVEKLMTGEKAEICFTSPPYANQREYNGGKELSTEHLATFIRTAFGSCRYFAVNLGYSRKDGEVNPYWEDYIKEANACGLKFLSWNVWDKGECGSFGNQSAMFGISHEWIFVFGPEEKDLNLTVPNKSAGDRPNRTGNRHSDGSIKKYEERVVRDFSQLRTVYKAVAQKARDEINHPARFPVEFAEGYIEAMTEPSAGVYEPFGGSGSTMIACEKTNRKCFMMEIDPHYCDVIIARFEKFTGKKAAIQKSIHNNGKSTKNAKR